MDAGSLAALKPSGAGGLVSPKPSGAGGFTLVELMIGATLSLFVLAGVMSTFLFLGRSGASVQNYNELETQSRKALEFFASDTREASALAWSSSTSVDLTVNGATVTYAYDRSAKIFNRTAAGVTTTLVSGVRTFAFKAYTITGAELPLATAGDLVAATQSTKQLQISLAAARSNQTVVTSTNNVLSARFVLRNKRVST